MQLTIVAVLTVSLIAFLACPALADGWDPGTQASNTNSILNTRHNLTVSFNSFQAIMNTARNDYVEVCVYCHTPHGANQQVDAPLWNHTISTSQYQVYDKPTTLNQNVSNPGPNSLTCLSCHDGTVSIDSVINMPGSGLYNPAQQTTVNSSFLDSWPGDGDDGRHYVLGPGFTAPGRCTICHNGNSPTAPNYEVFVIGTDLTNDHPVGIQYPQQTGAIIDFNQPNISVPGRLSFFDNDNDQFPDKDEVRLYDSGEGPEVECASCHDPHGVESGANGSVFNPSFLRVNNGIAGSGSGIVSATPSALCLTCHIK